MTSRVWKFKLNRINTGPVEEIMPVGAEILSAGQDPSGGGIAVWAKVDPGAHGQRRAFWLSFTGDLVPEGMDFVGTVVIGALVWHVWVLPVQ